jgi:predicted DNA binding CopG/RHH family protein
MQFTLEQEENNAIHTLDLTISRTDNVLFSIYRKPTTTNAIVPSDSCHPSEHKLSAIRYLHNRNATYMTTPEEKQNKTTIIKHILQANKYNTSFDNKHNKQQNRKDNPNPTNKKWAKFTYIGKDTRVITKLFKHTNVRIAFT